MIIISQNITNYDMPIPEKAIFRINLAWVNSLEELSKILNTHNGRRIFIDLPINRTKPPNNKYTLDEIIEIIKTSNNIEYFAISNVESKNDLQEYIEKLPKSITLVPKIESHVGIENVEEIAKSIDYKPRVMMLDHDDLYSNLLKSKSSPEKFTFYINKLSQYCKSNNITLLRTIGVIFSDDEKRVSEYVK
tara:strand:- start:127 stop:699 length:573 start_codon:yes stop_codon:yes gene_type:complete